MKRVRYLFFQFVALSYFVLGLTVLFSQYKKVTDLYQKLENRIVEAPAIFHDTPAKNMEQNNSYDLIEKISENGTGQSKKRIKREEAVLALLNPWECDIEVEGKLYSKEQFGYEMIPLPEGSDLYETIVWNENGVVIKIIYSLTQNTRDGSLR